MGKRKMEGVLPADSAQKARVTLTAGGPATRPWTWGERCYTLQYSWASLVAQLVKNLPAMRETWIESLGWKDPLEEGMAAHASILA